MKKVNLLNLFLVSLLFVLPSHATVEMKQKAPQYEGIEITVNINDGTLEELSTLLSGVGEKKAQLIIDYREKNGAFEIADDLKKVKGIGQGLVDRNRDRIKL